MFYPRFSKDGKMRNSANLSNGVLLMVVVALTMAIKSAMPKQLVRISGVQHMVGAETDIHIKIVVKQTIIFQHVVSTSHFRSYVHLEESRIRNSEYTSTN